MVSGAGAVASHALEEESGLRNAAGELQGPQQDGSTHTAAEYTGEEAHFCSDAIDSQRPQELFASDDPSNAAQSSMMSSVDKPSAAAALDITQAGCIGASVTPGSNSTDEHVPTETSTGTIDIRADAEDSTVKNAAQAATHTSDAGIHANHESIGMGKEADSASRARSDSGSSHGNSVDEKSHDGQDILPSDQQETPKPQLNVSDTSKVSIWPEVGTSSEVSEADSLSSDVPVPSSKNNDVLMLESAPDATPLLSEGSSGGDAGTDVSEAAANKSPQEPGAVPSPLITPTPVQ